MDFWPAKLDRWAADDATEVEEPSYKRDTVGIPVVDASALVTEKEKFAPAPDRVPPLAYGTYS